MEDRAFQNTESGDGGLPFGAAAPRAPWLALFGLVGLSGLVVASGVAIASASAGWFATLAPPPWTPAPLLVALLWAGAHGLSGVAAWLAWVRVGAARALRLWGWQLAVAALPIPAFFGFRSPALAVLVAVPPIVFAVWTTRAFWRASRPAAVLMGVVLAASLYQGYLAAGFWLVNGSWAR